MKSINIPIIKALSFKSRLIGLMSQKSINFGLYFERCNSVHTFFMKENIDILGLNEKKEIIFIERNVKANKIIMIHRDIKKTSILELPKYTSNNLKLGDKLFFEFKNII